METAEKIASIELEGWTRGLFLKGDKLIASKIKGGYRSNAKGAVELARQLARQDPRIHLIRRVGRSGLLGGIHLAHPARG